MGHRRNKGPQGRTRRRVVLHHVEHVAARLHHVGMKLLLVLQRRQATQPSGLRGVLRKGRQCFELLAVHGAGQVDVVRQQCGHGAGAGRGRGELMRALRQGEQHHVVGRQGEERGGSGDDVGAVFGQHGHVVARGVGDGAVGDVQLHVHAAAACLLGVEVAHGAYAGEKGRRGVGAAAGHGECEGGRLGERAHGIGGDVCCHRWGGRGLCVVWRCVRGM